MHPEVWMSEGRMWENMNVQREGRGPEVRRYGNYVSRLAAYIQRYQDKDWCRIRKPI
jgi:hypothetical protein